MTQPLLTPREHRVKAMLLRARNPNSRAAQLHEVAADIKDLQCAAQRTLCDISVAANVSLSREQRGGGSRIEGPC